MPSIDPDRSTVDSVRKSRVLQAGSCLSYPVIRSRTVAFLQPDAKGQLKGQVNHANFRMNPMDGDEIKGEFKAVEPGGYTRRGRLRNGNPGGDLSKVLRCGAWTRRRTRCNAPGMKNGRCRIHGGVSTGPRTAEGLARSKKARWKHGKYSALALKIKEAQRRIGQQLRYLMKIRWHR